MNTLVWGCLQGEVMELNPDRNKGEKKNKDYENCMGAWMEKDEKEFPNPTLSPPFLIWAEWTLWSKGGPKGLRQALLTSR